VVSAKYVFSTNPGGRGQVQRMSGRTGFDRETDGVGLGFE
jgi:hypothetical protein